MGKKDLTEIKNLEIKSLRERVTQSKKELADLIMDKNIKALKDLKDISKKKKDIARILTVIRQKELLEQLEGKVKS